MWPTKDNPMYVTQYMIDLIKASTRPHMKYWQDLLEEGALVAYTDLTSSERG